MTRVDRPALLRRLFGLGCEYSAQILSYYFGESSRHATIPE